MSQVPADTFGPDGCPDLGIPSCLVCPLPACRYEMPPGVANSLLRQWQAERYAAQGMTNGEIATAMGLSYRSVCRLLRHAGLRAMS